jgi:lysophospholipase
MTLPHITPPADLEERFTEPKGWRWHHFKNARGKKLRFGTAYPDSRIPNAVVVILLGRNEYAEKYFEISRDLLAKNLSVWILEWQGQGLSDRFLPKTPERCHSPAFTQHVEDLHDFILEYVKHACVHPDVGRIPMVMLAQSMGANIGLRYLHDHPGMFESAVLCAPMLGVPAINNVFAAPLIARAMSAVSPGLYAFGQRDWAAAVEGDPTTIYTSDPKRRAIYDLWLKDNPSLRLGGVTFGWVNSVITSCRFLQDPEILKAIKTPCLVAVAGKENLVDNNAIRAAAGHMPAARVLELPESGHEIMMERDEIRNQLLDGLMKLIKETIIDRPESLKTF